MEMSEVRAAVREAAAGHMSLLSHLQVGGEPPPRPHSVQTLLHIDQSSATLWALICIAYSAASP